MGRCFGGWGSDLEGWEEIWWVGRSLVGAKEIEWVKWRFGGW